MTRADGDLPTVLCALAWERRALLRAGVARCCHVECCGPGAEAVARWADRQDAGARGPIILAGVAGALTGRVRRGHAYVVSAVHSADGRHFRPTYRPDLCDRNTAITAAPQPVRTPADRRHLADRTGAELVDMESIALATMAFDRGRPWAIVRGVSDGGNDLLPPQIDAWVDEDGRTNRGAVARSILGRPWLALAAMRLGRHGGRAMRRVARRLMHMVESSDRPEPDA